jgi:SAM-dependent methyltransferase
MKHGLPSAHQAGFFCTESDLLAPSTACPLCEFAGERPSVLVLQQAPDVHLLSCPSCGGASASRIPTPEALTRFYDEYYSDRDESAIAEKVTFDQPRRFARHLLRLMPPLPRRELRILDFGGGDGALSLAAGELLLGGGARSVHIDVVDYYDASPQTPDGVSMRHVRSLDDLGSSEYDLVLASAVVEHLPAPRRELIRLLSAIAPAGFFYARTPWVLPLSRLLRKFGSRIDFFYPCHLHDLGRDFWNRVLGHLTPEAMAFHLRHSATSLVESGFSDAFFRTLAAYTLKAPSRVLPSWPYVGGWEVIIERIPR